MEKDIDTEQDNNTENELLNPEGKNGYDWFTKLATVERARAVRRETQKARKGKPITFSETGRRAHRS